MKLFIRIHHVETNKYWDSGVSEGDESYINVVKEDFLNRKGLSVSIEDSDGNHIIFGNDFLNGCIIKVIKLEQ